MSQNKKDKSKIITPREIQIILLCTKDYSRKMIADTLKISIRTVDTHLKNIHIKTKTHTMAGVVSFGFRFLRPLKKS